MTFKAALLPTLAINAAVVLKYVCSSQGETGVLQTAKKSSDSFMSRRYFSFVRSLVPAPLCVVQEFECNPDFGVCADAGAAHVFNPDRSDFSRYTCAAKLYFGTRQHYIPYSKRFI